MIEHNHPPYQAVSWWCQACRVEGDDAILILAQRIQNRRFMADPELLREGYESYKDWKWGDE